LRRFVLVLLFPIVAPLWLLGWVCYVTGKRKETNT
jgi:hypothetical protein